MARHLSTPSTKEGLVLPIPDCPHERLERPPPRRVVRRPGAALRVAVEAPSDPEALLRPAAACPRCGARPAMRVTSTMVAALRDHPCDERVATYQCQRRGCGAVYDLTAAAYLRAA
jgi:hypothetical protein